MNSLFSKMTMLCAVIIAVLCLGRNTALAEVPLPPEDLTLTITPPDDPAGDYQLTLSWSTCANAVAYRVYMKAYSANFLPIHVDFELYTETQQSTVTISRSDVPRMAFVFRVVAVNGDGESGYSNAVSSLCGREWDGDISEYDGDALIMIVSDPPTKTPLNEPYQYDANVIAEFTHNPAAGDLHYTLTQGPAGMTISSQTGLILWTPNQAGSYPVSISVSSSKLSGSFQQDWTVQAGKESTTDVGDKSSAQSSLSAFPNPASSLTTFRFTAHPGQATAQVTDLYGMEVSAQSLQTIEGTNTFSLDVRNLSSGMYFLRIKGSGTAAIPFRIAH